MLTMRQTSMLLPEVPRQNGTQTSPSPGCAVFRNDGHSPRNPPTLPESLSGDVFCVVCEDLPSLTHLSYWTSQYTTKLFAKGTHCCSSSRAASCNLSFAIRMAPCQSFTAAFHFPFRTDFCTLSKNSGLFFLLNVLSKSCMKVCCNS